jgi:hypothetical protein
MLVVFPRFVFRNCGERRSFPPVPAGCNETEQREGRRVSGDSIGKQRLPGVVRSGPARNYKHHELRLRVSWVLRR